MLGAMSTAAFVHFVFVDFENVQEVNLSLVEKLPAHVTLLIGKNQKNLSLVLVQQIRRQTHQVDLVEVGATGRNALDLTLAFHLGQAVQRSPGAGFYIVSKDKDFDPLIGHLHAREIKVSRAGSFDALPCLPRAKKSAPAAAKPFTDRRAKVIARLMNPANLARPSSRDALVANIKTSYGKGWTSDEGDDILRELVERRALTIDPKGKVNYLV
jgi:PIN domain